MSYELRPNTESSAVAPNANFAFADALFRELLRAGVRDVCICPGSRSAPLAVCARNVAELRAWIHLDERSAGYFALGLAKASAKPVALLCTSGTAAANFLPAVVEAHYAQVPLIVLTADRPPELRDWGAGQTIDQLKLYGTHVRWFAEVAGPEASTTSLRYARALACRAVAMSQGPPAGAVHLNLPLREPLEPTPRSGERMEMIPDDDPLAARGRGEAPYTVTTPTLLVPTPDTVDRVANQLANSERGILACGPSDDPELASAIARLGRAAGWPILAEASAQLRFGPHLEGAPLLCHAELFLRSERFATAQRPECILRFGATPTSKHFRLWLERHPETPITLVDASFRWDDPSHLVGGVLRCDPKALCHAVAERLEADRFARNDSVWLATWLDADRRSARAIQRELASDDTLLEARIGADLSGLLPDGTQLFLSSSMPIRDIDTFAPAAPKSLRVLCNRGANGIDGVTSSALGASAAQTALESKNRTVLLTGDLAFLHDLGGLLATKRCVLDATLVIINNGGGGIFSFLPIASFGEQVHFEELFTTPHGLDFEHVAQLFGMEYARAETSTEFRQALARMLTTPGTNLLELKVSREASVAQHRRIVQEICTELGNEAAFATGAEKP